MIYVLRSDDYDSQHPLGVFDSLDKAELAERHFHYILSNRGANTAIDAFTLNSILGLDTE